MSSESLFDQMSHKQIENSRGECLESECELSTTTHLALYSLNQFVIFHKSLLEFWLGLYWIYWSIWGELTQKYLSLSVYKSAIFLHLFPSSLLPLNKCLYFLSIEDYTSFVKFILNILFLSLALAFQAQGIR